jgi:hypothetical protein
MRFTSSVDPCSWARRTRGVPEEPCGEGRSQSEAWAGSVVWSTTASSSLVRCRGRSARAGGSWSGCLPAGRCHGLCSTAATTRPSCPWTLPRSPWRCWCGCDPIAASTPTRHHGHPAARAGRVATGPSSTAPTRPPGRSRPPPWAVTTSTAPSPPRHGGRAASQTAAPPRPRHPWATADRARGPSCASRSNASPPGPARPRCCGCGGSGLRACSWISTLLGGLCPPVRPGAHHPVLQADLGWTTPRPRPPRPG